MFAALLAFFIIAVVADTAFGAAVIYHLSRYTLPGRNAARIVLPIYGALSLLFFGIALWSFLRIPFA